MMTFNQKLVVLRKIKHLTQDEFASAVGVSRQAVYKWESGQSYPEAQKLVEIKLLFGISIDDLLDDTFEIELPKKKRRQRKPKTEQVTTENAAPVTEAKPAPKAEEPKKVEEKPAPKKTEAPKKAEAPKKTEAPKKVEAPKAEPVVEKEPVVEDEPVEKIEKTIPPKFEAAKIDIVDPTDKYAKKGGLFGRIFGKK